MGRAAPLSPLAHPWLAPEQAAQCWNCWLSAAFHAVTPKIKMGGAAVSFGAAAIKGLPDG